MAAVRKSDGQLAGDDDQVVRRNWSTGLATLGQQAGNPHKRPTSPREAANRRLLVRIREYTGASNGVMGMPRMLDEVGCDGETASWNLYCSACSHFSPGAACVGIYLQQFSSDSLCGAAQPRGPGRHFY